MGTRMESRIGAWSALVGMGMIGCGSAATSAGATAGAAGASVAPVPAPSAPVAGSLAAAGSVSTVAAASGGNPAPQPTAAAVPIPPPSVPPQPMAASTVPASAGAAATVPAAPVELSDRFMADAGDGWKTLVLGRWEVPPGDEIYQCVRFTIPEAINVTAFRALSPPGTHHTFLMADDTAETPDGVEVCSAATIGSRNITGSGVGTNDFTLPASVAMQLKPGQQLILNLHLFNTNETPLKGVSGTLVRVADEAGIKQFAEGVLAGPVGLNIPPGPSTQSGVCTFNRDSTIFGVIPHMHQLGVHLKAVAHSSVMGDVVLSDLPYDFESQIVYPLTPEVQMKSGDTIAVDCAYENTTQRTVAFGESSLDEMCFAGLYRYPAGTGSFICAF